MMSLAAATTGSTVQSSYAAANASLDSLVRRRRAGRLPVVSLVVPPIFGIGYIAQHREIERALTEKGMIGILEPEIFEASEVTTLPQTVYDDLVGSHHCQRATKAIEHCYSSCENQPSVGRRPTVQLEEPDAAMSSRRTSSISSSSFWVCTIGLDEVFSKETSNEDCTSTGIADWLQSSRLTEGD